MALATDPRPIPNLEIYDFDGQHEDAFAAGFVAHNVIKPATTQNKDTLVTPRVECQFKSGQQQQRSYLVPGTSWAYQNFWAGTMELTVITNRLRDNGKSGHRRIRSLVRWMMQDHANELTARMKYLTVIQVLESNTSTSFEQRGELDGSQLNFAVIFNIRPSAFPTPL